MSSKPSELNEDDPVLERFQRGLENWEHPYQPSPPPRVRSAKTRGILKTRGTQSSARPPEDDSVRRQFQEGLEQWEHPFAKNDDAK